MLLLTVCTRQNFFKKFAAIDAKRRNQSMHAIGAMVGVAGIVAAVAWSFRVPIQRGINSLFS